MCLCVWKTCIQCCSDLAVKRDRGRQMSEWSVLSVREILLAQALLSQWLPPSTAGWIWLTAFKDLRIVYKVLEFGFQLEALETLVIIPTQKHTDSVLKQMGGWTTTLVTPRPVRIAVYPKEPKPSHVICLAHSIWDFDPCFKVLETSVKMLMILEKVKISCNY